MDRLLAEQAKDASRGDSVSEDFNVEALNSGQSLSQPLRVIHTLFMALTQYQVDQNLFDNYISRPCAIGTHALKSYVLKVGQRTLWGLLPV